MDTDYIRRVQEWVALDNKILKNKEDFKEAVERKKQLEDEIIKYVEDNKFDSLTLAITGGNVQFAKKTSTQSLTMKLIRNLLEQYADEKEENVDVEDICDFITSKLEKKSQVYMKRSMR